jgi:membrane-associated phospholipid phosphatase
LSFNANRILSDLKRLFVLWGEYYSIPIRWKTRQWLLFITFISLVVISAFFDEPVRYFFFTIHSPLADSICKFVHWFGTGWANLYLFSGFYFFGFFLKRDGTRLTGLMVLQSYLYSGAITISLKSLVGRWRPNAGHGHLAFTPFVTAPNAHLSFPSGDVAVVFSLAAVMASLSKNIFWKASWILLAVLTSLSRIYYDAHWFSDVIFSTANAFVAGMWLVKNFKMEHPGKIL